MAAVGGCCLCVGLLSAFSDPSWFKQLPHLTLQPMIHSLGFIILACSSTSSKHLNFSCGLHLCNFHLSFSKTTPCLLQATSVETFVSMHIFVQRNGTPSIVFTQIFSSLFLWSFFWSYAIRQNLLITFWWIWILYDWTLFLQLVIPENVAPDHQFLTFTTSVICGPSPLRPKFIQNCYRSMAPL